MSGEPSWFKRHWDSVQEWRFFGIKVVPKSLPAKVISVIISLGMFLSLLYGLAVQFISLTAITVQVFLPNPDRGDDGAFYQDGAVQKKGFDKALDEAEKIPGKLKVEFNFMKRDDTPEIIMAAMKESYEKRGGTFFVMTMSTKIGAIRAHFERWHDDCVRRGKREPVLIATVASAPDLPNAASGIVRWYIRSDEESALLAEFMRWKLGVTHVAIFSICRNAGVADDTYGRRGMEVFRDRFEALGGSDLKVYNVNATSANGEVTKFLAETDWRQFESTNEVGVFVVGFGDMVRNTLAELIASKFAGPIVCASTLSEPEWQPKDTTADARLFTVLPRFAKPHAKFHGYDRNMVFYFSKNTLLRVLEMTASDPASSTFIERWKHGERDPQLDQEYLANGDTIVQLDVVGITKLR
jgi:hypothetical protein